MATRSERFLTLFNELEQHFRETTDSGREVSFGGMIGQAAEEHAAVRHYQRELKEWADLRNAIVHAHPRGQIIAEVTPDALGDFERLVERVTAPPQLIPLFQRDIRVFSEDDPIIEAVQELWTNHYSQVIVRPDREMLLLSYAGITRWLASRMNGSTIEMEGTTVGQAMEFEEPGGLTYLARHLTVYDAREQFLTFPDQESQRLRAIVLTHNGKATEAPLGIVTASDLVELEW